jgi:hypothetical protein
MELLFDYLAARVILFAAIVEIDEWFGSRSLLLAPSLTLPRIAGEGTR